MSVTVYEALKKKSGQWRNDEPFLMNTADIYLIEKNKRKLDIPGKTPSVSEI